MQFLRIAWRDLWRNRRRSLLTGLVMTFSVGVMILFVGLSDGSHRQMILAATDTLLGHAQVQPEGFRDEPDLQHRLEAADLARVAAALEADRQVKGWAPRLVTGGLVSRLVEGTDDGEAAAEVASEGAMVLGVRPDLEGAVSVLPRSVLRDATGGRWLQWPTPEPDQPWLGEAVLGVGLARVLQVGVGDRIALSTGTARGRAFASVYRVVGLVETGSLDVNRTAIITQLDKLASGLDLPGAASIVVASVEDVDDAPGVAAGLEQALAAQAGGSTLHAFSWKEISPELYILVMLDAASMLITLIMLVMVVGVILMNVVTMSVMERTREYGVRLAVGESPGRIMAGLVLEAFLLSGLASALGVAIGEGLNLYFRAYGIDLGFGNIEIAGVLGSAVFYSDLTLNAALFSVGTVMGFAVLGSLYPAWRIHQLHPVDALRFV
jgi:ABC-type lipoprotein release transport system permease subunit